MGLISKKIIKTVSATVGEKVVNKISDKATERRNRKIEEEKKLIENLPFENKYMVRSQPSSSIDLGLWDVLERDSYIVYDDNDNPFLIAKGALVMGKHHFIVTNKDKIKIATIHKELFKFPGVFEKNRKGCRINIAEKEYIQLESYTEFDEDKYRLSGCDYSITADMWKKEFCIIDDRTHKTIAKILRVHSEQSIFLTQYVVAFNNLQNKLLALFICICLDLVHFSE